MVAKKDGRILPKTEKFMPIFEVIKLQAVFGLSRERNNRLFYKEYTNDKGICHFHSQIELYFVDDGQMEAVVNGSKRLLSKGEMSVALSYDSHAYRTPEASRSSVLIVPGYLCGEFLDAVRGKRTVRPFITDRTVVQKLKEYVALLRQADDNPVKQSGFLYVILGTVLENLVFEEAGRPIEPDLVSQILFYIEENYFEDLSLSSLAVRFGYEQSYLSKVFKDTLNIGFHQYLNMLRLKHALLLMEEGGRSITDCALDSGFGSMRTFYRVFTQEFGCTPKEYRKREHRIV